MSTSSVGVRRASVLRGGRADAGRADLGGLLLATSSPDALVTELRRPRRAAAIIGEVTPGDPGRISVRP